MCTLGLINVPLRHTSYRSIRRRKADGSHNYSIALISVFTMWRQFCQAFVVATIIGGMTKLDAQSTVDDSASCESSALDEAVNVIREGFHDMKSFLRSNQHQSPPMEPSNSNQVLVSSLSCEYRHHVILFQ